MARSLAIDGNGHDSIEWAIRRILPRTAVVWNGTCRGCVDGTADQKTVVVELRV
jgi:hypothetical protein